MKRTLQQEAPGWYRTILEQPADVNIPSTVFFDRDGNCYFDGVAGALVHMGSVPDHIQIAMDGQVMAGIVRMTFSLPQGGKEIQYQPFAPDAFAILWNEPPSSISGIDTRHVELILVPGDESIPIFLADGTIGDLYLDRQRFMVRVSRSHRQHMRRQARQLHALQMTEQ